MSVKTKLGVGRLDIIIVTNDLFYWPLVNCYCYKKKKIENVINNDLSLTRFVNKLVIIVSI